MKEITSAGLIFCCDTEAEVWRAQTLKTKEPGTIEWLGRVLRPGDVFYDIGANIGVYTLLAARALGPRGHVYAFEPHLQNALNLLRNVDRNALRSRVTVYTVALCDRDGYEPFRYASLFAGSSGHELGSGDLVELKAVARLDSLELPAPAAVKIDIDGQEPRVIAGMQATLRRGVRSLQVELAPTNRALVASLLAADGYQLQGRHRTALGEQQFRQGIAADDITDNGVFERVEVAV